MEIHVVRPGDTLYGIAVRYQADPAVLQELNGLLPDSVLAVGQTLVIRHVDTFHTVQPGQTLAGYPAGTAAGDRLPGPAGPVHPYQRLRLPVRLPGAAQRPAALHELSYAVYLRHRRLRRPASTG